MRLRKCRYLALQAIGNNRQWGALRGYHRPTGGQFVTKIAMTIALAVALSGCAGSGQPGYGGPASVGPTGTASDAVDNGGSTSSSMEAQRIKRANGNTAPTNYSGYGYGYRY
jgi:hypothetical protein